jgi:Gpi18-like mannosyltransferase
MMKLIRSQRFAEWVILGIGIALAVALRLSLRRFVSADFMSDTGIWYNAIQEQGFAAIGTDISNYTPAYLYLLYLVSLVLPTAADLTAVKVLSMVFDVVCAWIVYRMVGIRYKSSPLPIFSFFAVLFAPTIVLNSSMWGQADSLYTAMLLACIYFLITGRGTAACLAFGAALSLKLQAVFLLPLLAVVVIRGRLSWKSLVWIPVVYLASLIPAWIAGRPLGELVTIYLAQAELNEYLSLNAPNLYTWLPDKAYSLFLPAGLIWSACLVFGYILVVWKSPADLKPGLMLKLGLLSVALLPFVLPKMHERYFYPADMLSIAYAFYNPRHYYVPIAFNLISLSAYLRFLYSQRVVDIQILALAVLVLLVLIAHSAALDLYARQKTLDRPLEVNP